MGAGGNAFQKFIFKSRNDASKDIWGKGQVPENGHGFRKDLDPGIKERKKEAKEGERLRKEYSGALRTLGRSIWKSVHQSWQIGNGCCPLLE